MIIIDGLTKVRLIASLLVSITHFGVQNWRLPGWRVCWVVGPKNLITALSQSGQWLCLEPSRKAHPAQVPSSTVARTIRKSDSRTL